MERNENILDSFRTVMQLQWDGVVRFGMWEHPKKTATTSDDDDDE